MPRTGPQRYPGASTAYWYQDDYPGSPMEVNVCVLHTTEGTSLPSYGGGGSAPNLTAKPDFAAQRLVWYQHFDIDVSSRALRNEAGGVETNTLNVVQVELVGTCDPTTHRKWQAAGYAHIYWPEAPDWALRDLAAFLRWMNAEHGVPLAGPSSWPAYPSSYGNGGGQRLSASSWSAFKGVCGHMHVPENTHGDPGAIDFARLIALAKGTPTPAPEDDMPTADEIAAAVVTKLLAGGGALEASDLDRIWGRDVIPAPTEDPANPTWAPSTYLRSTLVTAQRVDRRTAELTAQVAALSSAVAALAQGGGLDAAEIQAAAEAGARAALDRLGDALTEEI